jgi:hypothetical protein
MSPRGQFERAKDGRHGTTASPAYLLFPIGERWRSEAACLDHPDIPPAFFDDTLGDDEHRETRKERSERIERAKAVCRTCPVMSECLRAVDLEWDSGVRGGLDLRELREKRRRAS